MAIPLLRIPSLAVYEIFKSMDSRELFILSFLSQRIKRHVKKSIPKNAIHIKLVQGANLIVHSGNLALTVYQELNIARRTQCFVKNMHFISRNVSWYTRDTDGVIKFLAETFNLPTASLNFLQETNERRALELFKLAKEYKLPITSMAYSQRKTSSKAYMEILNECKSISRVSLRTSLKPDFEFRPASPEEFRFTSFYVAGNTDWLNLDDFMSCQELRNHGSGPRDVTSCLKKMVTSVTKLKDVEIEFQDAFDLEAAINLIFKSGIDWNLKNQREDGKMVLLRNDSRTLSIKVEE